ncbi:MAG: outer membrane beta-barrel protein [Chitinophagaceae bacterium]|nr:outer membrane beta-barrel protein [Chitinophagaceae bacterium]
MKKPKLLQGLFIACLLLPAMFAAAQHTASIDLATVRNMHSQLNGFNVSAFYHFNEHLIGGIEMNRFLTSKHIKHEEAVELSSWDFDLNFHYLLPVGKTVRLYPLTGISHTSEKEYIIALDETVYQRFWSFNTGAGAVFQFGKWAPHIEYMFTWGKMNQQFLLAGISYELEWGKKEKEKK